MGQDNELKFPTPEPGGAPMKVKPHRANGVTTIPEGAIPFDAATADLEQLRLEADEALSAYAKTEVPLGLAERKVAQQRLLQAVRLYTAAHVTQGILRQDAELLASIVLVHHGDKEGAPSVYVPKVTTERLYASEQGFGILKQDEGDRILVAIALGDPSSVLDKAVDSAVEAGADGIDVQPTGDVPAGVEVAGAHSKVCGEFTLPADLSESNGCCTVCGAPQALHVPTEGKLPFTMDEDAAPEGDEPPTGPVGL